MAQIWLLASCVFLCLTAGDAVLCKQCSSMRPWIKCWPEDLVCGAITNEMLCMTLKVYKDFEVWQKVLSCTTIDDERCNDWYFNDETGKLYAYSCCFDKDLCNDSI